MRNDPISMGGKRAKMNHGHNPLGAKYLAREPRTDIPVIYVGVSSECTVLSVSNEIITC